MKRLVTFCIIVLLLITTACQQTPNNPIVVGKDSERMMEQAQGSPEIQTETMTIREKVVAPEKLIYSYSKGKLAIEANTGIMIPDGYKMPIIQVKGGEFSQDIITRVWDALISDTDMWMPNPEITKAQIESAIMNIKQNMQSTNYDASFLEEDEAWIAELENQYLAAPDTVEVLPADSLLKKRQQLDESNSKIVLEIMETIGYNEEKGIYFEAANPQVVMEGYTNEYGSGLAWINYYTNAIKLGSEIPRTIYELDEVLDANTAQFVHTTPTQANDQVERLIKALDIPMQISDIMLNVYYSDTTKSIPAQYFYDIYCVRDIAGIPMANIRGMTYGESSTGDILYNDAWAYETMNIKINDSGIVEFAWRAPLLLMDTKVESCTLLPFSEIQSIFAKMLPITYAPQAESSNMTLEITDVHLEMARVVEQNSAQTGLIIPVWNFYGIRHRSFEGKETESTIKQILLCVNAIDGSIVDVQRGY